MVFTPKQMETQLIYGRNIIFIWNYTGITVEKLEHLTVTIIL